MTTNLPCPGCGSALAPGMQSCGGCVRANRNRLSDVPGLLRELDLTISRQATQGEGGIGSCPEDCSHALDEPECTAGTRVDYHVGAAKAQDVLVDVVQRWAIRLRDELALVEVLVYGPACAAGCAHPSCRAVCAGVRARTVKVLMANTRGQAALLAATKDLGSRRWAPDLVKQLRGASDRAWQSIDRPPNSRFVGWCPAPCDRALYAREGNPHARCAGCGQTWDADSSRATMLEAASDRIGPAAFIAGALGVAIATIRQWKRRGKLHALGVDEHGKPTYRLGDARAAQLGNTPLPAPDRIPTPPEGIACPL